MPHDTNAHKPTIGLIVDVLTDEYQAEIWKGITDKVEELNLNLICYRGGEINMQDDNPDNIVYNLINGTMLDGLIVLTGAVGNLSTDEELARFFEPLNFLPMISIGRILSDVPSIIVDNKTCMHSAVTHLIESHAHKRIAFIKGTPTNPDAEERYTAYKTALAKYDIPLDENLIMDGNFTRESGYEAMIQLLDKNSAFDAVLCADDFTAFGAIEALSDRDKKVPGDYAVIGFDDIEESCFHVPPLTTLRQPLYEQGQRAVVMMNDLLMDKEVPMIEVLHPELKIRRTCGCLDHMIENAAVGEDNDDLEEIRIPGADVKEEIEHIMLETVIKPSVSINSQRINQIIDSFINDLNSTDSQIFLPTLEKILGDTIKEKGDVLLWNDALSILRKKVLPGITDDNLIHKAENLWQQGRVLISEVSQRELGFKKILAEQQASELRSIGQNLITTFNLEDLKEIIAKRLPTLDIPGCYFSLYQNKDNPTESAKLVMAYDKEGVIDIENQDTPFDPTHLLPEHMLDKKDRYTYIIEPLYFMENQLGYILFEKGQKDGAVYDALRAQISGALEGARLLDEVKNKQQVEIEKIQKEMEIAKKIQTALIPQIPRLDEYRLSATMMPADDVGGDYYDFFTGMDGRYWYVIGDVSGHGLTAGLIMLMAQSSISTLLLYNPKITIEELYNTVNSLLFENIRNRLLTDQFMTLSILSSDHKGNFTYIGSHVEHIIYRVKDGKCEDIKEKGLWLGLKSDVKDTIKKAGFFLNKGDILLLFTDGLVEAMNKCDEQFDINRVKDLLIKHNNESVEDIKKIIFESVFDFMDHQADDVTIFLVKKT